MNALHQEIKTLIIECLRLEDIGPADIESDQPLFGEGLGLDSVDALELGMALQTRFGITLDADTRDMRHHFSTVGSLADLIMRQRASNAVLPEAS